MVLDCTEARIYAHMISRVRECICTCVGCVGIYVGCENVCMQIQKSRVVKPYLVLDCTDVYVGCVGCENAYVDV